MQKRILPLMLLLLLLVTAIISAQDIAPISPDDVNPDANISWPPPVYVLRGEVEIRGSANLPGMSNYFVEFRPLVLDTGDDEDAEAEERPWFPATLPSADPVTDEVLGSWNTATAPDGLYELRLTVNTPGGAVFARVSPVRVENNPPDFVQVETPVPPTATAQPVDRPTLAPSPTPLSRVPTATARVDANVRRGDDTRYDRIGFLLRGESAEILGISSFGSGWYYIQLPNGRRGFIAPSTVDVSGDVGGLTQIDPPPPPTPIATATPIPTNTPVATANLHFVSLKADPSPPQCGESFDVIVGVENNGTAATTSGGTISVSDRHVASGTVTETTVGAFPALEPGESFEAVIPITVTTFFEEAHSLTIVLDSLNDVAESNEGDNISSIDYTLGKGSCD